MSSCPVQTPTLSEMYETTERLSATSSRTALRRISENTTRSYQGSRFLTAQNVFESLGSKLQELTDVPDNWNSYESPAPNAKAVSNAKPILQTLRSILLEPERIVPSAEGGVAFTFISQTSNRAIIESLNNGERYILLYDLNGSSKTIDWPFEIEDGRALVEKLASHLRSTELATH